MNRSQSAEVTRQLSHFVVAAAQDDLPATVRHAGRRAILNWLGCALGACRDVSIESTFRAVQPFFGPAQATLVGRGGSADMLNAALINAMAANAFDFDDTHLRTVIHPSASIAAALFAVAEYRAPTRSTSGLEWLNAFALGVEVACRVGNAISPGHYRRGFHITGTCGVLGAAAAVGKLLGLDAERMGWAIGHGATQASGLVEMLGSMSKTLNSGSAARNGIVAALLAQHGFTGSDRGIEAPFGFAHVLGNDPSFGEITDGLGATWELLKNAYKPYPCGVVLHPVIDACLALRSDVAAEDIEQVLVKGHPLLRVRADRRGPRDGTEARLSIHHSAAVSFICGAAGLIEFSDDYARRSDVRALGDRVQTMDDNSIPVESADVTVRTHDGRTHHVRVDHALGSTGRPMTDAELEQKFRAQLAFGARDCEADELIARVWAFDTIGDASTLTRAAVPRSR